MSRRKQQVTETTGKQPHHQPSYKLEGLWDDLLSRQPKKVQAAYLQLEMPERKAVTAHLQRMVDEPGWQPEQRASAKAALQALERLAQ